MTLTEGQYSFTEEILHKQITQKNSGRGAGITSKK